MKKAAILFMSILFALIFALAGCATDHAQGNDPDDASGGAQQTYYTVTFDSNGGTHVRAERVLAGNPVRRPTPPTREGYFFNGWFIDRSASADRAWDFDRDRVNANITLYAGWTAESDMTPTESLVYVRNETGTAYTVTGVGEASKIVIPAVHEGLPVTVIQDRYGTGAFANKNITSVIIPDSIEVIGQNTFYGCNSLTEVILSPNSALREVGNNAFAGCSVLERMYLPATLTDLGDSAFNNCGSLREFSVAEGNPAYRAENGHLIERATNTLVRGANNAHVPESVTSIAEAAFRRANGITELYLPISITELGDYCIANSTIATIHYAGTQEQWNGIVKSEQMWNYGNRGVVVQYRSTAEEGTRILVVYFSVTGKTEEVAQMLAQRAHATLWEIEAEHPYTMEDIDYTVSDCRANVEQRDANARPSITGRVAGFSAYESVFIGYPIWQGIAPRILQTFLESYDFSNKEVYTFSTSFSSAGSYAHSALAATYATIRLKENLHFTAAQLPSAQARIDSWLSDLGI